MKPTLKLPLSVSNLYSELLQQVMSSDLQKNIGDIKGTFVKKTLKGHVYWYLQHSENGKTKQTYLGPENPELKARLKKSIDGKKDKKNDLENRKKITGMFLKGGGNTVDSISARIIALLARSGVYKMGGVLVGSHAFLCYANMLGVTWPSSTKTNDIDIAQDESISIALVNDKLNIPNILEKADMGFLPIPQLSHKHPSTSFKIRGQETHVDFLTPLTGKEKSSPVFLPSLQVAAQPLRFLDYLLEDVSQAVLPYDDGILVTVPNPSRFALHKLLISQKRGATFHVKSQKDVQQAALLLSILIEEQNREVKSAWKILKKKGSGWTNPILKTMPLVKKSSPALHKTLSTFIN